MKTKQELLEKYKNDKEFYEVINAHYGTKTALQDYDGTIITFDKNSMKDIVNGEKLTYDDFIDIQIQTGPNYRGSFMLCYYYYPQGFKGQVERFSNGRICFKRIHVEGMYPDGTCFKGKEDHVWMLADDFNNLKIGDCVSFFAEPYRYIKTGNGKKLDFGLRNPVDIKKINKYDLPSDEELMLESINGIICESCYLNEQCSKLSCNRSPKELKATRESMMKVLKTNRDK